MDVGSEISWVPVPESESESEWFLVNTDGYVEPLCGSKASFGQTRRLISLPSLSARTLSLA